MHQNHFKNWVLELIETRKDFNASESSQFLGVLELIVSHFTFGGFWNLLKHEYILMHQNHFIFCGFETF